MQYTKIIGRDYSSLDSPKIFEATEAQRFNGVLVYDPEKRGYEVEFIHEEETEDEFYK